jgi:hypothetical protein
MFSAIVTAALLFQLNSSSVSDDLVYPVDGVTVDQVAPGLFSVDSPGFEHTSGGNVLLPERTVLIPVPPGEPFSVTVIPSGVRSLGTAPVIAASELDDEGYERFVPAQSSRIQSSWGEAAGSGTFRRAGYVAVRIRPAVVSDGELLAAGSLRIILECDLSSRAETVRGHEGEIFQSVFGTREVWRTPVLSREESPFWGKPWARILVDTAGVFEVTADLIPEAVGMPSSSFSLITGRGRMMSTTEPFEDSFVPRSVPVFVDDGGDGTFDSSDRVIFYGRGLSWWGEFSTDHFNSMYDSLNTYWLTWGGSGGPFMETIDGSLTGAQSVGTSYMNRLHFEQNQTLSYGIGVFDDLFGWHRISSAGTATAYYSFTSPGTTGQGTARISLSVQNSATIHFTAAVNGTVMADTAKTTSGAMVWEFPVTGLKNSGNSLALKITKTSGSRGSFVLYTDCIEVFPETGFRSWSTMCQVPLDRSFPSGERRAVSWAQSLDDNSFVCVALSDTAVVRIDIPGGKDFEVEMPENWVEPVMWVVPGGSFREPVSVTPASPGRIIGTLEAGRTVYIYPNEYAADMPLFQRGRSGEDALFLSLTEIYDEFNGGVRDPGAIRAFFHYTLRHWNEAPGQLVLVGAGDYDPRGFVSSNPGPMDIIVYSFHESLPVCSDFLYTVVSEGTIPQAAVSRIAVDNRTELQLVAQRSSEYSDPSQESGTWQSIVLGAADDERSPKYPVHDETYHTNDTERIMSQVVPHRFIPLRHYLINYDWNSNWKKPQAREDYIERWNEGALVSFYVGHGGFDQIADEGLLYIEDADLLSCGPRLPYSFFASCDVGVFQNPAHACIAQKVTVVSGGGAIVSSGASTTSVGGANAAYLTRVLNHLLSEPQFSMGECQWMGLVDGGFIPNDRPYIIFGDGSLHLALPDSGFTVDDPRMLTSELCEIQGTLNRNGLVMLTAWESAVGDSYYTHNQNHLIEYLSTPGVLYRGLAEASPSFNAEMFIPSFAQTGDRGRVRYFAPGSGGGSLVCSYPVPVKPGSASGDTEGPEIEMWLSGFRGAENPSVSGDVVFEAALEDSSGINLLPYPGVQLALYIDDSPVDVSEYFSYEPGSATKGRIVYPVPELQPGDHNLRLRAADNVTNISWGELTFHLTDSSSPAIEQLFVYPSPASTVMSFNWVQSMNGPVSISVYTVSGRLVSTAGNLTGITGYNQHNWNLCDQDGDAVASGLYIYVVSSGDSEVSGVATVVR